MLGPFAFLCHQKWDSASKIPLLPAELPMLLLSGVQDEVVPREHMQGLWELVEKRVPGGVRTSGGPGGAEAEGAAIVSLAEDEDWQKVELYVFPTALPLARAHGRPAKF